MNWVNKGSVLPPPYNLIPNPKAVIHLFRKIRNKFRGFNQVSCNLHIKLIEKQKLTGRLGERMVRQETEKDRKYRIYPCISQPFKTNNQSKTLPSTFFTSQNLTSKHQLNNEHNPPHCPSFFFAVVTPPCCF